jgi:hypothetical protein
MIGEAERIAAAILDAAARRGPGRTLCPSEVARALDPDGWRALMPAVRDQAARLAAEGLIAVTQAGLPVDARTARGPIRLGLGDPAPVSPAAPPSPAPSSGTARPGNRRRP